MAQQTCRGEGHGRVRSAEQYGEYQVYDRAAQHNLVLYTVYGPPEHADHVVHATKKEADAAKQSGQDQPAVR